MAWHGTLSEMGMVAVDLHVLAVGPIESIFLDANARPTGDAGHALERAFRRLADDLSWWTEAAPGAARAQGASILKPRAIARRACIRSGFSSMRINVYFLDIQGFGKSAQ